MSPQEIQAALARGMNFDAVMAQHAADIQREQGIDMGLSMARARTDVQNIQNQRDEGIDPPQFASPRAKTIGAEGRRLSELDRLLTGAPPRPAAPDLTQLGAQAIAGLPDISGQLQDRLRRQQLMDISTGDVPLTPSQQVMQDALLAQLRAEPQYQAAFQTQADMPTEVGRFARAKAAIPQNIPRDILAALRGMPPSALRDESIAAVQNLPNIPANVPLDPNEFARFATPAGDISQSDISDFIRRAVTPTPSFTEQATQPIAGTLPAIPSDFSDFEGMVAQPSATMAAGDVGRFARAGEKPLGQALDPNEAARFAEAGKRPLAMDIDSDVVGRFARAGEPILPAGIDPSEISRFAKEGERVLRTAGTGEPTPAGYTGYGGLEYIQTGVDDLGNPVYGLDTSKIPEGSKTWMSKVGDFFRSDITEEERNDLMEFYEATQTGRVGTYLAKKEKELANASDKASETNNPADIANAVNKRNEVNKVTNNIQAIEAAGFDVSELEGLAQPRTSTFYKPENETQLKAAKAAGIIPQDQTLKQAQDNADKLLESTVVPQPAITPPIGTPPVGTPPMGTSVIGGGGFAPAPAATLAGLGELGGVLGDRSQYVQSMLTPEQQLARYSSFLPTTALTPQLEEYMQEIALPQMEAAFYAQGGDLPGSPYATTAGSPYSAFENFMRTGSRLDPAAFQEYLGEVSGALQAGDPTQRQQFLSSLYASPEQQLQLLYQGMGAGTSAATRGALGRMLGRQYRQQQFQSPASAFLPSALARGGIGGAFSQYITPQGTVAAAGQPPAMSTIMANQGMPPARPRTTAEIMATMPSYTDRTGTVDMEAAMYPELYDTTTTTPTATITPVPTAIPPATVTPPPVIAPTPTVLPSLTATRKVNFADVPASATYGMTGQEYQNYLADQRKGLTQRRDAEGNLLPFWDALDPDQTVVTSPTGQTMITKKALAPKPKKKKKKDEVETPSLISQGEMLF